MKNSKLELKLNFDGEVSFKFKCNHHYTPEHELSEIADAIVTIMISKTPGTDLGGPISDHLDLLILQQNLIEKIRLATGVDIIKAFDDSLKDI